MLGHLVDPVDGGVRRAIGIGRRRADDVDREQQLLAVALDLFGDETGFGPLVRLRERSSDRAALGEEERVRHTAADGERVDLWHERAQHIDLRAHLGATDNREERPAGIGEQPAERVQLLFEQQSGVGGEEARHSLGRGVCAMRRPERVVHVRVETVRETPREIGIVRLLLGVEAHIFEERDVTRLHRADRSLDIRPDAFGQERHDPAEQLSNASRDRRERELRIGSLRASEMRDQAERRAAFDERADRRQCRADARVVGDLASGERYVEVDAHEDALSPRVEVPNGALGERHARASGRRRQARGASRRQRP